MLVQAFAYLLSGGSGIGSILEAIFAETYSFVLVFFQVF